MPFVVAERVPWEKMCETLNLKFMAEVGTSRGLLPEHFLFLAQKIFNDNSLSMEAFQHRCVSWSQFNKVIPCSSDFPPQLFTPRALRSSLASLCPGIDFQGLHSTPSCCGPERKLFHSVAFSGTPQYWSGGTCPLFFFSK